MFSYEKFDLPLNVYDDFAHTWAELPEDKYAKPGFRFRRFGYVSIHDDQIFIEEPKIFVQSSDINKAFGDQERQFQPLDDNLEVSGGFHLICKRFAEVTGIYKNLEVHQVRILVGPEGVPAAPEGPHQDGYDFIGAFIAKRENITGGEFIVWPEKTDDEYDDKHVFMDDLYTKNSRHFAILNDREFYHTGRPLHRVDPNSKGIWDWIVIGANKC